MEIRTRFDIGQDVWFFRHEYDEDGNCNYKPSFGEIEMIAISHDNETFYFVDGLTYEECELFETESEMSETSKNIDMKYFTIDELCKSDTARKLGIQNVPTSNVVANLTSLVKNVLDPLRTWYGKPINVNSGYRCEKLNNAVKGAKTSQHLCGCAADIDTNNIAENKKLFDYIRNNLTFDQVILEKKGQWVHVSYVTDRTNRKQVLWT